MKERAHRKLFLLASLAIFVSSAAVYRWVLYPWRAPPPVPPGRVEALWHEVETTAKLPIDHLTPADLPILALDSLQTVEMRLRPQGGLVPSIPAAEIGPEQARLLEELVAWSDRPATNRPSYCTPLSNQPLRYHALGRLALARAEATSTDPLLIAALRLAQVLRRRETLAVSLTGIALASEASAWMRSHRMPIEGELLTLAPTRQELLSALARDHVCFERSLSDSRDGPWYESVLVDPHREVQMLRWYLGSKLAAAITNTNDAERLAAAYGREPVEETPKSLACRAAAMDAEKPLREALIRIDDYSRPAQ